MKKSAPCLEILRLKEEYEKDWYAKSKQVVLAGMAKHVSNRLYSGTQELHFIEIPEYQH